MEHNFSQYITIFAISWGSGVIASIFTRIFNAYFEDIFKNTQEIFRGIIQALIYSILIYFGLVPYLLQEHNLEISSFLSFIQAIITVDFWNVFAIFMIVKLVVFLLADFVADRFAFDS